MKLKSRNRLLGIYDVILAIGATYTGYLMIRSNSGIFTTFPKEWLDKVPFDNWATLGFIVVLLFGLGNMIASITSIIRESGTAWVVSGIMGTIFLLCMIAQIIVLDEVYLASLYFIAFSLLQLALSYNVYLYLKKGKRI